jgi:hypothetical protein
MEENYLVAFRRFEKGTQLRQKYKESDDLSNELFARISKLDKTLMKLQHEKLAKQILESLNVYSDQGLLPWECSRIVEDITQDVLRKFEVYYESNKPVSS